MTAAEWVMIIGVITTSVVTIINAFALHWGHKEVNTKLDTAAKDRSEVKSTLNQVQDNTNGRISSLMNRVKELEEVNRTLSSMVEKRGRFPGVPSVEPRSDKNG
jgi:shikimate kinase